ncbi:hypothetical protein TNCV_4535791 [Trichonephila clavipes]|nr:hypothetical protein TNCV_4535791 [Trichonephila clavipes]
MNFACLGRTVPTAGRRVFMNYRDYCTKYSNAWKTRQPVADTAVSDTTGNSTGVASPEWALYQNTLWAA